MTKELSIRKFAEFKGWHKSTVEQKLKEGRISREAWRRDGRVVLIDVERAEADLLANTDQHAVESYKLGKAGRGNVDKSVDSGDNLVEDDDWLGAELAKADKKPKKKAAGEVLAATKPPEIPKPKKETREIDGKKTDVTVVPPADSDAFARFRSAKTDTETMRARKLELEVAEMEGRLLDVEEVRKRVVRLVGQTRDSLGNLSSKLAPLLVGINDVVEMETTLQKEINLALASLSELIADE